MEHPRVPLSSPSSLPPCGTPNPNPSAPVRRSAAAHHRHGRRRARPSRSKPMTPSSPPRSAAPPRRLHRARTPSTTTTATVRPRLRPPCPRPIRRPPASPLLSVELFTFLVSLRLSLFPLPFPLALDRRRHDPPCRSAADMDAGHAPATIWSEPPLPPTPLCPLLLLEQVPAPNSAPKQRIGDQPVAAPVDDVTLTSAVHNLEFQKLTENCKFNSNSNTFQKNANKVSKCSTK